MLHLESLSKMIIFVVEVDRSKISNTATLIPQNMSTTTPLLEKNDVLLIVLLSIRVNNEVFTPYYSNDNLIILEFFRTCNENTISQVLNQIVF